MAEAYPAAGGFSVSSLKQRFEGGGGQPAESKNPFRANASAKPTPSKNPFSPAKTANGHGVAGEPSSGADAGAKRPAGGKPLPPKKPNDLRLSPQLRRKANSNRAKQAKGAAGGSAAGADGTRRVSLGRPNTVKTSPAKPTPEAATETESAPATPAAGSAAKPRPPSKPSDIHKRASKAINSPVRISVASGSAPATPGGTTATSTCTSSSSSSESNVGVSAAQRLFGGKVGTPEKQPSSSAGEEEKQKRFGTKPLPLPSPKSRRKAAETAAAPDKNQEEASASAAQEPETQQQDSGDNTLPSLRARRLSAAGAAEKPPTASPADHPYVNIQLEPSGESTTDEPEQQEEEEQASQEQEQIEDQPEPEAEEEPEQEECAEPAAVAAASSSGASTARSKAAAILAADGPKTYVIAKYDHNPQDDDELSFKKGDRILLASQNDDDWWQGVLDGKLGHFPRLYVVLETEQAAEQEAAEPAVEVPLVDDQLYGNMTPDNQPLAAISPPEPSEDQIYANCDIPASPAPAAAATATASATVEPQAVSDIYENVDFSGAPVIVAPTATPAAAALSDAGTATTAEDDEEEEILLGEVLFDYEKTSEKELTMRKGETVEIFVHGEGEAWWCGAIDERDGWFPASYVKILPQTLEEAIKSRRGSAYDESDREDEEHEEAPIAAARKESVSTKAEQLRAYVAAEIIKTEKDYVANLEMMIRGYMMPMRRAVGQLFDEQSIKLLFSNIEQLHQLHVKFERELEAAGVIGCGACIAKWAEDMHIYSVYCSNHPRADAELVRLLENDFQMETFFEGCRLLVEKELSLQGFLLKPVQRICQYPLMLKELLKNTPEDHEDHQNVKTALEITKAIASTINEEKRNREELARLQATMEGWDGPDINDISTRLVHEGVLTKISNNKAQERHFYLFDNLFVYCKRNITGKLEVKGKIFTDSFTVIDVKDGEVMHGKTPIKNAFRINNSGKNKWYVLYAKTPEEKQEWVSKFIAERELVARLNEAGIGLDAPLHQETTKRQSMKGRREKLLKTLGSRTLKSNMKRKPSMRPK